MSLTSAVQVCLSCASVLKFFEIVYRFELGYAAVSIFERVMFLWHNYVAV